MESEPEGLRVAGCLTSEVPAMEMSSAWVMFLLLAGSQVPGWSIIDEGPGMESYFLATVEYALHIFNVKSKDTNAYRLVSILDSQSEKKVGDCIFLPC